MEAEGWGEEGRWTAWAPMSCGTLPPSSLHSATPPPHLKKEKGLQCSAHQAVWLLMSYELNCVSPTLSKFNVEVLTPSTSDCDLIWK